jgi:hypothetical protein
MIPSEMKRKESGGSGGNHAGSGRDFELKLSQRIRLRRGVVVTAGEFHACTRDDGAGRIFNDARQR